MSRGENSNEPKRNALFSMNTWKAAAIGEVDDLGKRLAGAVEAVLARKPNFLEPDLAYDYREIDLPLARAPGRDQLKIDMKSSDRFVRAAARDRFCMTSTAGCRPVPAIRIPCRCGDSERNY